MNLAPAVLIVDDVPANLVALEALLEQVDCTVFKAESGNDALRALLAREYAVMLLDVQMPQMDGFELAELARSNPATRDVPIIFLTAGHGSHENVLRGYGSGAVDYLLKPLDPEILLSKVSVFLELHTARRKLANTARELAEKNSELERINRELKDTQVQLIQSAKMASLGTLVAGVAHEINNPLAFALSHLKTARLALSKIDDEASNLLSPDALTRWRRAEERLTEMTGGLERIRELVVKLRTFSRMDDGARKQMSIREAVDSLLLILAHRIKGRVEVETHLGEPDVVECFPSLMSQAVMNLLTNSIDAIEDTGRIAIAAGADGDAYRISVTDSGSGIPAELRERVCEPFFTTKPVGEGTGLGLSIAYSIVRSHGGTLELSDVDGGGTRATITIPRQHTERRN